MTTAQVRPSAARPERPRWRRPRVLDHNETLLVGAVARGPTVHGGQAEFTLAGRVTMPGGKVLPWYHKVRCQPELMGVLTPGAVVRVCGRIDQHKFVTDSGPSFILNGGTNVVRLSRNLSRAAERCTAPSLDPYVRLSLAPEGMRDGVAAAHFFTRLCCLHRAGVG